MKPGRPEPDAERLVEGLLRGDRTVLAQAITLVESTRPDHRRVARELLSRVMPHTGGSTRVGFTGVPGVGKSTFIDAFGTNLTAAGRRVAVLAIDPSSGISGGSILGDKTRMPHLAADDAAFIRPSPGAGTLGGVAARTREALLLCEAAGFDVVLVETIGVGQSETTVAEMTDFFLVLMLPGAGDELQGIKRGLLELADLIAVNKADGDNEAPARLAASQYASALRHIRPRETGWAAPVLTCSARDNLGLDEIWKRIGEHRRLLEAAGRLDERRREQMLGWMWSIVDEGLRGGLREAPAVRAILDDVEREVRAGTLPPTVGAHRLLAAFRPEG